ncbi:acetylcholinesterase [Acrasis kona]|uniref:Acetylcholinesterase n=1 Tax=Acrasis kona TaxID=1008807 RepID=A0AAW2ZK23_9EUKA
MKTLILILSTIVSISLCQSPDQVIRIPQGYVGGFLVGKIRTFYNIPFAKPPVGSLRFRKPAPLPDAPQWQGIRDATTYGPLCHQDDALLPVSEDCLQLNIWSPLNATNLPVMVFVHGGAFTSGGGQYYSGRQQSQRDVVVVSINYRLGAFGFIGAYDLIKEDPSTGNYGILDQLEAFKWINKNIHLFGGDASQVTAYGESAGAISLAIHLVSPVTPKNLFHRVIIQSAGSLYKTTNATIPNAELNYQLLKSNLNCTDLSCMRNRTAADINFHQSKYPFIPIIDNVVLTKGIFTSVRKGEYKNMNIIVGTTSNEMSLWTCPKYDYKISESMLVQILTETFGEYVVQEIYKFYKRVDFEEPIDMLNAILSDSVLHCPSRYFGRLFSSNQEFTYQYTFDYGIKYLFNSCFKATHASELPILFPDQLVFRQYNLTKAEETMSNDMLDSWATFAKTGIPTSTSLKWEKYNAETDYETKISVPGEAEVRSGYYKNVCSLWDRVEPE